MSPIFQFHYHHILCEDFLLKDNISNIQQIPSILSVGLSHSSRLIVKNSQFAVPALSAIELVCGQKAKVTKAKKSISGFQTRANQLIGCKVTLRKNRLFLFLEKFVFILLPRLNVLNHNIISQKTYNLGFEQVLSFPEIESYYDSFDFLRGCHFHVTTSTTDAEKTRLLLSGFKLITKQMT